MSKTLRTLAYSVLSLLLFVSLSAQAQKENKSVRQVIEKNALVLGISYKDAASAEISSIDADERTGISYVYLQQTYLGLPVYNKIITLAMKDNGIAYNAGNFVPGIRGNTGTVPAITALRAVERAASYLQLKAPVGLRITDDRMDREARVILSSAGIARREIEAKLIWLPSEKTSEVKLVWNVNIDVLDEENWWNIRIDALTGEVLDKDNLTVHENHASAEALPGIPYQAAAEKAVFYQPSVRVASTAANSQFLPPNVTNGAYRVVPFPIESPNFGSFAIENEPWLKAGAGNNATTHGWHFDGTNNYIITRGNNVFAYLDVENTNVPNATNNWPDTSSTAAPSLTFVNVPDFSQQPNIRINKKAGIDNLFYWNNIIHDVLYQYGFTESAGNFQADNIGRGGVGNDYVHAHGQDGLGLNNANFSTPVDGNSGRMQMYLFTGAPTFTVTSPAGIAGTYAAEENSFTSPNKLINTGPVTANIVLYNDDVAGTIHRGCAAATNASALAGNIAMLDPYGTTGCTTYTFKVKNAQNAGAIAVIVYSVTNTPLSMGGTDATITIPVISIGYNTAVSIMNQLNASVPVVATMASGIYKDGNFDNGVITHEYGHGVSNRLTGGRLTTGCLGNSEQGGEGWSDYFALMLTTNWATATTGDANIPRTIATYDLSQSPSGAGFRRYPYTYNMAVNPLTYANMATNTQVHAIGEIWCSTLWDMTWNIIQQTGSITTDLYNSAGAGGNAVALNLVMTGLKMQPCYPGYIDARNAILAADSLLYNGAYKCAIWNAFARRGMGASASQGSSLSATDQTVAFDVPSGARLSKAVTSRVVNSGSLVTITHTVACNCQAPQNGFVIRDTIPAGFAYVSSTGGTLSGNVVTFSPVDFTTSNEARTYSVTLLAAMTGCAVDSTINDNRDASLVGGLTPEIISGSSTWSTSTALPYSGTSSWYAPDPSASSNFALSSSTFTPGNVSVFSFYHLYETETYYDGGVVEIFNGSSWIDASPYIIENVYNKAMDASTILANRRAFTGRSGGYIRTTLNLSSFAGQSIRVRFRMTADAFVAHTGWYVDDVVVANGCGGFVKTGFYNSSGTLLDTVMNPVLVRQLVVTPLQLLDFNAAQAGQHVLLTWRTAQEINTQSFIVQRSADGIGWANIDTVAAGFSGNHSYRLVDASPLNGSNYYRLKMVDIDQQFRFSPVREVVFRQKNGGFTLIPNPAAQSTVLYFDQPQFAPEVRLYDMNGRLVQSSKVSGRTASIDIDTRSLPNGVYTVSVKADKGTITARLVVAH